MSPAVTPRPLRPSGGAGPADPVLVASASYRRAPRLVRGLHFPGSVNEKTVRRMPWSRSPLVLFLAFVAGLCGGALLSLGAWGMVIR